MTRQCNPCLPDDSEKCEDCLCENPLTMQEEFDVMMERLAALEHEQWAHWTAYFLQTLLKDHPELGKDENILRWSRQILTEYKDLSEKEKESDRKWAQKSYDLFRDVVEYL